MKKLTVESFARLVKIGTGVVVGAAATAIFYHSSCVSLKDSTVLENVSSDLTASSLSSFSESAQIALIPAAESSESALININTATSEELQTLPGIGEAKAAAIIAYREEHGIFNDISEIMNIDGIGDKIFENIRDRITAGGDNVPTAEASQNPVIDPPEGDPININTATSEELQTLSGIGEAKAAAIIAYREEHGIFADISEIINVSGIGAKTFEKIRGQITV